MGYVLGGIYVVCVFLACSAGMSVGYGDSHPSAESAATTYAYFKVCLAVTAAMFILGCAKSVGYGKKLPGTPAGLIVLSLVGSVQVMAGHMGFAVVENANNSNARDRVLSAVSLVEEYSAGHKGDYPVSQPKGGNFTKTWMTQRPDDYNASPWGGLAGPADATGVEELPPVTGRHKTADAALEAAGNPGALSEAPPGNQPDPSKAAELTYVQVKPGAGGDWVGFPATDTRPATAVKFYAVGIRDKNGVPWWEVKGGK